MNIGHSHKKYLLPIILLSVIIVALLAGLGLQTHELVLTQDTLTNTQTDLTATKANLDQSKADLASTQIQLTSSKTNLASTQTELTTTKSNLVQIEANLTTTQTELTTTKANLVQIEANLTTTQTELNTARMQYNSLTTGYNYLLSDPNYQDMKSFLATDQTDTHKYDVTNYVCWNYCADVITNAAKKHIRCGFVVISYPDNTTGHAIVAFNTRDRGIIYIEPQTDDEVRLRIGLRYWASIISTTGYYPNPSYDDTVTNFTIIW